MAGRRPLPTALKVLRGNPGKRPMNRREPRPTQGEPEQPAWMTDEGREEWAALAPELLTAKILTLADAQILALTCEALAEVRRCTAILEKAGRTYRSQAGRRKIIRPHPAVAQLQDAWRRARAGLIELGCTPASRSRLQVGDQQPENPLLAHINRRRRA